MGTITFDTLELVDKLKCSGIPQAQAEAQDRLVTKEYIDHKLEKELALIKTDLAVLKWGMGVIIASSLWLVLKGFFDKGDVSIQPYTGRVM